jgi:Na+-driven multidrug efflux pump
MRHRLRSHSERGAETFQGELTVVLSHELSSGQRQQVESQASIGANDGPLSSRTRRLLEAPIAPTLLRLAAPNIAVMLAQAAVNTCEAYFIGSLGPEALAGASLVFPLIMLMQTMSAGGMGGGVASAVARALGAGRRDDANALVLHAMAIACLMGGLFTIVALWGGPMLYRAMGGVERTLTSALAYSNLVFAGAVSCWLLNTLASLVRGTGTMLLPASVVVGGALVTLPLSPALMFGWGPFPPLGITGAAIAIVAYYSLGSLILLGYLCSGQSLLQFAVSGIRFRRRLFWEILRVGAPGSWSATAWAHAWNICRFLWCSALVPRWLLWSAPTSAPAAWLVPSVSPGSVLGSRPR